MMMLIVLMVLMTTQLVKCVSPPVVVSTVFRSIQRPSDVDFDRYGHALVVTDNAVFRGYHNGTVQLIAGGGPTDVGYADGAGASARFYDPCGIACDASANLAYISDYGNHRIRMLNLSDNNVTTFAGSSQGFADGVGTAALFYDPVGIVRHAPDDVLYVADRFNMLVRKILVATANVTTIGTTAPLVCRYLSLSRNGTLLYASTELIVMEFNLSHAPVSGTTVAGGSGTGSSDGVGTAALFNVPSGVALNTDESALFVAEYYNNRIRRIELSTNAVTTVAGSGSAALSDGLGSTAAFNIPMGLKWHCNTASMVCGVLVMDFSNDAVRFVAIEHPTPTASASPTARPTATGTTSSTLSRPLTSSGSSTPIPSSSSSKPTRSPSVSSTHVASLTTSALRPSLTVSASTSPSAESTNTHSRSASEERSTSRTSSLSATKRSHSTVASCTPTRTRWSASPTVFCALIPAVEGGALASLMPLSRTSRQLLNASGAIVVLVASIAPEASTTTPSASEVSRQELLSSSPIAANISLTLGGTLLGADDPADGWTLVHVSLDVVPTDASFPVLTTPVACTVLASMVAGRQQLLAFALHPPATAGSAAPRWLPSTLSVFRSVTLQFRLTLRCPANAAVAQDVLVFVPSPGQPLILATEVRAAGTAAMYSSPLTGLGAGSAVGRLAAVRALVECSGDGAVGGMLPLPLAAACEDGASAAAARDARGAVLGNLVLWAAGCALMALVTSGYARGAGVSFRHAAEALGAPSPLLPLVVATVPSTVSGTFVLLRSSCAADSGVGAVGVAMCVCPVAVLCGLSALVPAHLQLAGRGPTATHPHPLWACLPSSVLLAMRRLLHRHTRWVAAQQHHDTPGVLTPSGELRLERVATVVVLEYRVVWYLCVDVAVLTAAGFLGAVSTFGSLAACRGSAVAVMLLYAGQLVLCAVVRPFTTLFSHVHTLLTLALGTVSVCCQVWYLFASARDGADLDALSALLAASAVCDIIVSAVSMLRTALDVVEALRALRRHALHALSGGGVTGTWLPPAELPNDCHVGVAEADDTFAASGGLELLREYVEDELLFWRHDGTTAVGDANVAAHVIGSTLNDEGAVPLELALCDNDDDEN